MKLYAQHGYGKGSKIEKGIAEKIISGIILSPKAENPDKIKELIEQTKTQNCSVDILFDPQFYICAFAGELSIGKLSNYPYYASGLTRIQLSVPSNVHRYVKEVIEFQQNILALSKIISPTILFDTFDGTHSQISVSLAYESISMVDADKLFISLCINENAFRNLNAMDEFLNVLSLFEVKGFYITIERSNNDANQLAFDGEILSNIMYFCYVLSTINEFEVILGYTDLLLIPLITTGISASACGWHNGQKIFSESNFQLKTGGRHAIKKYTSNKLLNSITIIPEMTTIKDLNKLDMIMSATKYDSFLQPMPDPANWTDEISCLENWEALNSLVCEVNLLPTIKEKVKYITSKIKNANTLYEQLDSFLFMQSSRQKHLDNWLSAIEMFSEKIGISKK
ncbi:hypothetical protein SDC9_22232 [bioreactor metagenome]|uniref:Uncharacterized protein n=1 Tax=bioreactor metagenome TaxID=1076179 RepID=A0A644UBU1_9ZZZZ|nr:hypothetical protein [Acidaminococcaceae bacterium]